MRLALFLLLVFFSGCMPNQTLSTSAASEVNISNLSRIELGMTQAQVLKIMRHPYSDKVFIVDQDTFDVWFYVTNMTALGQSRMMPLNLTPLTFKNGILIGRTYSAYNFLKKQHIEVEKAKWAPPRLPEKSAPTEMENKNLEQLLQPAPGTQPAPQTPGKAPSMPSPAAPQKQTPPKGGSTPAQQKKQKKGTPQSPDSGPNWGPISPQDQQQKPAQPGAPAQQKSQQKGAPTESAPNWGPIGPQQPVQPQGSTPQGTAPGQQKSQQKGAPSESGPDWSPLEKQTQPPAQDEQNPASPQVSMSKKPANQEEDKKAQPPKKPEEKQVPLNEGDEEMLQEEREQDFNQT